MFENLNDDQGLAGFIRAGFADKNVNQVDAYFGSGITYNGLIPSRDEDVFGFAIAASRNCKNYITKLSQESNSRNLKDYEYIFELTYEIKKRTHGRYLLLNIQVSPAKLVDIDHQFKLNNNLLKFMFVRKED